MFENLKPADYPRLRCFFEHQPYGLCEYSLASILSWNRCIYNVTIKVEGETLLIAEKDVAPPGDSRLLMPLSKTPGMPEPRELAALALRNGFKKYHYVPEDYLRVSGAGLEKYFTAQEQPGFMDYIYGREDLAALKGHKYAKKRNLIAQFAKQTAALKRTTVEPLTPENTGLCLALLDRWAGDPETGKHLDMLNCERKAIINSLENLTLFEMRGVVVKIGGEVSGFAFGAMLSKDTFVLNFEKALDNVKGLYQFLDKELAKSLPSSCALINKESDLEKPGLAKAKESYYPCRKTKSHILTLK